MGSMMGFSGVLGLGTMRLVLIITMSIGIYSSTLNAADQNGIYEGGGGVGAISCSHFASIYNNANVFPAMSLEYVKNVDSFIMYIEGFRAAYNMQTEDTYDIFSNLKSDQILAYSNHFCSNNPLKKFTDSIVSLSKENFENRKKKL